MHKDPRTATEDSGRVMVPFICSKDVPWNAEKHGPRAQHPDAVYLDEEHYWGESYEKYRCPWCGLTFKVELPQ